MQKHIIDEKTGIPYTLVGDYLSLIHIFSEHQTKESASMCYELIEGS